MRERETMCREHKPVKGEDLDKASYKVFLLRALSFSRSSPFSVSKLSMSLWRWSIVSSYSCKKIMYVDTIIGRVDGKQEI